MKILTVAIPNHHFFQWVNQLESSGHEVYWFDITDGNGFSEKIGWVKQFNGWKLRWDYPLRQRIKKHLPKVYQLIQTVNERSATKAFKKVFEQVKPDIVHCFEMQLAGLPILPVLEASKVPLVYSSWGSDLFIYEALGVTKTDVQQFLKRVDYLITDCERDYHIAKDLGYINPFLGVFPGNGGIALPKGDILTVDERDTIMVKGYDDGVGQALVVLKALAQIPIDVLKDKKIVVYSADQVVVDYIKQSTVYNLLEVTVYPRGQFVNNAVLLRHMGTSLIHIASSTSDGMPNALLETMGMGAFPIQSNPGGVTEEVITHRKNGLLIDNPTDEKAILNLITIALQHKELRVLAQDFNTALIEKRCNRVILQDQIQDLYQQILTES